METRLYFFAAILFYFLTVFLAGAIIYGVHLALKKTTWPHKQKIKIYWFLTLGLIGWLGLLALGAHYQFFADFNSVPPRFILIIVPPWLFIAWLTAQRKVRDLINLVPAPGLVYLQTFRVVVELVLWLVFAAGVAPVQMTFEGRNFDILVGLTAPLAAYFFFRKNRNVRWGVGWNIFGLVLLLNIVTVAILSAPSPFRQFWNEPANTFVTTLPFIWLPGFVVPLALALHIFSLIQLSNQGKKKV